MGAGGALRPLSRVNRSMPQKNVSLNQSDVANAYDVHISMDRMREVAMACDVLLNDEEAEHIRKCTECLYLFGELIMPKEG